MARLPRLLLVLAIAAVVAPLAGQAPQTGKPSIDNGEWPDYSGDLRGWRYSPLDQINASNFNQLQVAWRFKTDNLGPRPEYKLEGTPVLLRGTLSPTGGRRRPPRRWACAAKPAPLVRAPSTSSRARPS